ncbi:hypothetical protein P692DRAFT_20785828, partial [Suillus brevipes Sb2]
MVVPVGSVSSTRAVHPTGQESSMLFNRLNAMAVAIHLDPSISNTRHRVLSVHLLLASRASATSKSSLRDLPTPRSRPITLALTPHFTRLRLSLWIMLSMWMPRMKLLSSIVRALASMFVSGLSMSTRCLLTLPSSSAWVKDVYSPNNPIAIENDSSAACQEVVSAFLDARMKVLPRPTVPPTLPSVDNQESQDEYDKPFIDLNDPEILAALGDEPAQTSGMEWKRKEEAVCKVCGPLASAIFQVVCRYVVDSPALSTVDSRHETADQWIDCWVGVGNVLVQNGSSWKNHMHFGPESWERIPDPLWRRGVGLRFCFALLRLDSKAYNAYEDYFIEVLLACTVPSKTTIEHEYASIVFTLDGLRHPLLRGVLAEPSTGSSTFEISREEYPTVRQTLIESVFANFAERLQDDVDPVNY